MVQGSNGSQVNAAKPQVECARGRTGGVPVDEPDQRAITPDRVPRRDVLVAHHQTGPPGPPGEPGHVRRHLLDWATESVSGEVDFRQEVAWLATVLEDGTFLPTDLPATSTFAPTSSWVSMGQAGGPGGRELATVFTAAAGFVRYGDFPGLHRLN